ncbi:hypothetical protein [Phytoactinopolyspora endophytica]|uniref:hypothetical protein n=1 Tax=Phytoactinopolyspora endophytica TaxID=1642495 RepID=UPI00101B89A6|nr:hypothetical protein [Phytoactinopolyspora endophytica]
MSLDLTPVEEAFRRARIAVASHTDKMAKAHATWREETATELVLANTHPVVRFADFTRGEESTIGADWLWWWVGQDGTSFGALVQAKKLTFTEADTAQVKYRHSKGRQFTDLLNAAKDLEVPAMYAVYFGGLGYRSGWPCEKEPPGCDECERLTITMVPVLAYSQSPTPAHAAELARQYGVPLENLTDAETWWPTLPLPTVPLATDLRDFLIRPQDGAREVAQAVMRLLITFRSRQFERATPETALPADSITADRVFTDLPDDRLHNGNRYFEHVLRGLRRTPPGYVLDIVNGNAPPTWLADQVAGVSVVQLPARGHPKPPVKRPRDGPAG